MNLHCIINTSLHQIDLQHSWLRREPINSVILAAWRRDLWLLTQNWSGRALWMSLYSYKTENIEAKKSSSLVPFTWTFCTIKTFRYEKSGHLIGNEYFLHAYGPIYVLSAEVVASLAIARNNRCVIDHMVLCIIFFVKPPIKGAVLLIIVLLIVHHLISCCFS